MPAFAIAISSCIRAALWNGRDPILKERMFGLSGNEGNHGEDVKEYWFYLDNTPTHSYMRMLYKYPQREFPYAQLLEENRKRQGQTGAPDTNCLIPGSSTTTATSTSSSSTPSQAPKTFVLESRLQPRPESGRPASIAPPVVPQYVGLGPNHRE